ncbi:SET domain-containing protein, partial [Nadsonia fulvescens var. elongata DSM 6958]
EKYSTLKQWFVDNKCGIHPYIEIKTSPLGGVGVFATKPLIGNTPLLSVPKEYTLCPTTCGISNLLEEYELTGMIGLTVAFMFEKNLGKKSPWWGYLNTVNTELSTESLPRFWTKEQQEWLKGTEIVTMGGLDEDEIKQTFSTFILPFFQQNFSLLGYESIEVIPTYEEYCKSLVAVSSRAFEVDAYRGLALVPGACLFNHSDSEQVHFETNEDVCDLCGADGCEHDLERLRLQEGELSEKEDEEEVEGELTEPNTDDEDSEEDVSENEWEDDEDMVDDEDSEADDFDSENDDDDDDDEEEKDACDIVVSVPRISTGSEIFNTYGEENNGILLSRYGFALIDNQHESVSLVEQVIDFVEENNLQSRLK